MRRSLTILAALAVAMTAMPQAADAQSGGRRQQDQQGESAAPRQREPRIAPLQRRPNAGPCPYVKILYDAARYVEIEGDRPALANVGFTGEIEGVNANCAYRGDDPIRVDMDVLFRLGRGARAEGGQRTYRYWIAVTERNRAILAKEYFDLPVDFRGQPTAEVNQQQTIVIPRAEMTISGAAFEILVGFDVTPEMAEFNRSGSRFRIPAGQAASETP